MTVATATTTADSLADTAVDCPSLPPSPAPTHGEPGRYEYRTVKLDSTDAFRHVERLRDTEGWRVLSVGWDSVQMERRKRA